MDIIDKFVEHFYKNNLTFDEKEESKFREQMLFAREHYAKTDKFLNEYYNKWCLHPDALVLPYGVFRTLFFDIWEHLGIKWVQDIKLKRKMKKEDNK